jgi:hypothetical protein
MASSRQMKTSKSRDFQKEPMNLLEAEIAVTALLRSMQVRHSPF